MREGEIILKERPERKEGLKRIKEAKESNPIGTAKRLFPEFNEELIREELSLRGRTEMLKQFIKGKPEEELLSRAQKLYKLRMDEADFVNAYNIAKEFLDKKSVEVPAQELLKKAHQEMKESEDETTRINTAKMILSDNFVPEIKRPSETVEEALETLFLLRDKRQGLSEIEFYKRNFTPKMLEWLELPIKNEKIFEVAHFFARERIRHLIRREKEKAPETAQAYADKGLLNLDTDGDLFEELTE